jgi:hypothetical protein
MLKDIQTSNLRLKLVAGVVLATAIGLASADASAQTGFTTINVAGAGTGKFQGTVVTAIDAAGDVAGIYRASNNDAHGFVLPSGGAIATFDAPGEADGTFPIGFDSAGDLAGMFEDSSNRIHGFLRAATTGTVTQLDVPGEDTGRMEGTFPVCINGAGEIAGIYSTTLTTASGTNSFAHGFVRSAGGTITTFDAEPLPTTYGSTNPGTYVLTINATGEVAGFYIDGVGAEHGFLRTASGTISTFEAPNAGTGSEQGTIVTGIDAAGDVIGAYTDTNNMIHGFVRNASTGTITVIDAPGAGTETYQGTYPDAFDAAGDIFGSFTDVNNVVHGFVLPDGGTIATYDAPGAVTSGAVRIAASANVNSKLRQLGKSYGLSLKQKRSNSPLMKLRSVLARVGAVTSEGTGLLNGNGPNPSGTASYGNLIGNAVNASGEIVGIFTDGNYVFHGYLRGANGSITTINGLAAGTTEEQGTGALAINASGIIAGTYADSNSMLHGFIYDSSVLTATTTTLTPVPTPNPSVYQEPVTLTASVTSSGGTPANGENVTFMSGTTSLGAAQLTGGVASLTTTDLSVGTDSITAVYGGDSDFAGSTSMAVSQTVNKASSSTTLTSSPNPSSSGQSVTFTANISGQFSGVATGTVTFSNGNSSLGSASVSSNMATLATTTLPVGTDSITATYSGDSKVTGSSSNTLSQVVNASAQAATPTFSPIAGTYTAAQSVTISDATSGATIYYTTNGTAPTTGSTVYSNSSPIAVSSSETIEAIATASGYSTSSVGSAAYVINIPGFGPPSGSQPGSITIQPGASTGNTATISVVGTNGFSGTVNLSCSITPVAANDPPTCTLSPASVTLSGTTTETSTLTVTTSGATSSLIRPAWQQAGGIAFAVVLMFAIPRRQRSWLAMLVLLTIVGSIGFAGCGGGSGGGGGGGNSGTAAGTYTIKVTGTSGNTSATIATVTLTVQ